MPDGYNASVAAQQFDAARRLFLHAVDQFLAAQELPSADKVAEITVTSNVLQDKLRLMGW